MVRIRLATPDDAEAIVGILRKGLGDTRSRYTIACCFGMVDFVRAQLMSHELGSNRYFISEMAGKTTGFAEFRLMDTGIFLNHIYVEKQAMGSGCGKALLHAGLALAQKKNLEKIGLDVFSDNQQALRWYEKLGFSLVNENAWLVLDIGSHNEYDFSFKVLNKPFADCVFSRFGFATLELETASGAYRVGLLGKDFFRVTMAGLLKDKDAMACLQILGPTRKLLCIDDVHFLKDLKINTSNKVASSFRMSADIAEVRARMEFAADRATGSTR